MFREHLERGGCVNALNGLLSFLRDYALREHNQTERCQRPERASFISTKYGVIPQIISMACVNALNGLLSFLHYKKLKRQLSGGVNALNGLLSFLLPNSSEIVQKTTCVNALNGLLSFLREKLIEALEKEFSVNALNGLLSFLHSYDSWKGESLVCQRPERASFISTEQFGDVCGW